MRKWLALIILFSLSLDARAYPQDYPCAPPPPHSLFSVEGLIQAARTLIQAHVGKIDALPVNSARFSEEVRKFLERLQKEPAPPIAELTHEVQRLKDLYIKIDRSKISPKEIYDNEYQLRFMNSRILSWVRKQKQMHEEESPALDSLLFTAQIRSETLPPGVKEPGKTLPIEGVKGSDVKLEDWQDDPEFYNYEFDGDYVIFRGMKLRAGDLILNHTLPMPTGTFTSLADEPNSFSHSAMLVFVERNGKTLPVVVDAHEKGVRAVPLNVFLGPQVVFYAEVFRLKPEVWGSIRQAKLATEALALVNQDIAFNLSGTKNPHALSCTELVNLLYQRVGLKPFPVSKGFSDDVYANVLKIGKIERDFITPAQIAMSRDLVPVGYVDNGIPFAKVIANEAILKALREPLANQKLKLDDGKSPFAEDLGAAAIDQIRDPDSIVGDAILSIIGFNRGNFPTGSKELLVAVNFINDVTADALSDCTPEGREPDADPKECSTVVQRIMDDAVRKNSFSMTEALQDPTLLKAAGEKMRSWQDLFN